MKYATIVADPPWRYGNQNGAAARGHARSHYDTLTVDEIAQLDVVNLALDDSHLWLWGVNQLLDEAYAVARAWGFSPLTLLTWCKRQPGVGYYLRNNTEHCLFATRGKPIVPDQQAMASWFVWPRSEHSRKPDAFTDLVEQISPGPYLELFSRRQRLGWDTWGDQALEHVTLGSSPRGYGWEP